MHKSEANKHSRLFHHTILAITNHTTLAVNICMIFILTPPFPLQWMTVQNFPPLKLSMTDSTVA